MMWGVHNPITGESIAYDTEEQAKFASSQIPSSVVFTIEESEVEVVDERNSFHFA